jgi:hypothetical protein
MGAGDGDGARGADEALAAHAARGQILAILELTRRPLRSEELAKALGLGVRQSESTCRWLANEGLIRCAGGSPGGDDSAWSLAEKGTLADGVKR